MRTRRLRLALTGLVFVGSLLVLSRLVDWQQAVAILARTDILLFGVAVGLYFATIPVRAHRWRILLSGAGIRTTQQPMLLIVLLGLFFNVLLPAKGGDIYRTQLLKERYDVRRTTALGTIGAERTLDVLILAVCLLVSGVGLTTGVGQRNLVVLASVTIGVLTVAIGIIGWTPLAWLPQSVAGYVEHVRTGLFAVSTLPEMANVVVVTLGIWSLNVMRFWALAAALGIGLTPLQVAFFAFLISLLSGLPYTPAGIGLVEVGGTSALIALDYSGAIGLTYVLLDRLASEVPALIVGAVVYLSVRRERFLTVLRGN